MKRRDGDKRGGERRGGWGGRGVGQGEETCTGYAQTDSEDVSIHTCTCVGHGM